jgi:hypothetical protein
MNTKKKQRTKKNGYTSLLSTDNEDAEGYQALLEELASLTDEEMNKRMRSHQREMRHERMAQHEAIFHADATKQLFKHLLGDVTGKKGPPDADVLAVTKGGVLALPVTMKWKQMLVDNATDTSQRFQHYAFKFSKISSNPIDNFANQIQAFIKKVEQFLSLMMDYTTPKGIHAMHMKVDIFVKAAADDVNSIVAKIVNAGGAIGMIQQVPSDKATAAAGKEAANDMVMGVFTVIKDMLDVLKSFLPVVIQDIKFAKKTVSGVANTLKSIFGVFKEKGGKIFDEVASTYASIWTLYYVIFVSLTSGILFYAFWANGWFKSTKHEVRQPSDNMAVEGCMTFLDCLRDCQDSNLCFWSCILVSEVVILIMFLVSILFCIIAGIKSFIAFGCGQIYVLGDDKVCTNIMIGLREWMETFWADMPNSIEDACEAETLVACKAISGSLMSSAKQTVIGSFVAAIFSFQMLFLSAKMHERARYNHVIEHMIDKEENPEKYKVKEEEPADDAGSAGSSKSKDDDKK